MERKSNKSTIKQWIFRMVFGGLIVMTAVFLIVPWYAGSRMRNQAQQSNEKLTKMYLAFWDNSVSGVNKVLSQFASGSYDISVLARPADKLERYMAKNNVMQKLEDAAMVYNVFDGIFVYSQSTAEDAFLCQVGSGGSGIQVRHMKAIMKTYEDKYSLNTWALVKYEDREYLMCVVKTGSTSCGAWIDAAALTNPLRDMDYDKTGTVLFWIKMAESLTALLVILPVRHILLKKITDR